MHRLTLATQEKLGVGGPADRDAIDVYDGYVGPGYGQPTDEMIAAVQMLARLEGILLDPVYSGKGMAGLIGLVEQGVLKKGENVVFIHTGGAAALFAYPQQFGKQASA